MLTRFFSALIGLRNGPAANGSMAVTLLENGWRETLAMGAWIPMWGITTLLLLLVGQIDRSWDRGMQRGSLTLATVAAGISVVGFILHMIRAAAAISQGRKLTLQRRPGGAYAKALIYVTSPTPWLLVPQVVLGIALAVFIVNGIASAR